MHLLVLSAFRPEAAGHGLNTVNRVSMHLLVLSAFRLGRMPPPASRAGRLNAPFGAQCFPTGAWSRDGGGDRLSQCTFWCSVLSDCTEESGRVDAG